MLHWYVPEEEYLPTVAKAATMAQGTEVVLLSMDTQQTLTWTIAKSQGLLTAVGQKLPMTNAQRASSVLSPKLRLGHMIKEGLQHASNVLFSSPKLSDNDTLRCIIYNSLYS